MPAYLCHGFRWHRKSIRYFVVIQDVDDAAPEWIVAPKSAEAILQSLYGLYDFIPPCPGSRAADSLRTSSGGPNPDMYKFSLDNSSSDEDKRGRREEEFLQRKRSLSATRQRSMSTSRLRKSGKRPETLPVPPRPMLAPPPLFSPIPPEAERNGPFNKWSSIKMLEEYDPSNELILNGPWAYLSDYTVRVDTSVSVLDEIRKYESNMRTEKFKAMSGPSDETGRKINTLGDRNAGWLEKLRDQLQREEPIKWYVVMCGDEERNFPMGDKENRPNGITNDVIPEDEVEFRLPEFDNYRYDRKSAVVQPLRLRRLLDSPPPPPTPQIFEQFQRTGLNGSLSQPRVVPRPQTQPQPELPQLRKPSAEKPPIVPLRRSPERNTLGYTPPPDPLANLRDIGSRKTAAPFETRPGSRKSTINLKRIFSKKQVENFI
ncbi:hypothetical protein PFICI_04540 [Pestalotiopsis fici W106-1]|uniref:Developmental regulator protein n=1 Tax=Pestalotiopsis fici (strain W106-1 / CGMCC3.15140) TaxID=1229662 RepID=W3X9E8_PESFW|nr:uncharacterized protein PFICI_04540 [Pestalotiopsis fici W106-1]ETS82664.1 hypothetical protein PFICI_04540 [Pestalotiopsis fici W106-1]